MLAQAPAAAPAAEGQAHAAAVARPALVGALSRAAPAAAALLGRVLAVVAQAEEPNEPEDEQTKVEDSEADHEDPPLQAHWRRCYPRGQAGARLPHACRMTYL